MSAVTSAELNIITHVLYMIKKTITKNYYPKLVPT